MHHQLVLHLVVQILPQLASVAVPEFDEAVHTACDKALSIRREDCCLWMRFSAEADQSSLLARNFFFYFLPERAPPPAEKVECIPFRKHSLGELIVKGLAQKREKAGRGDNRDLKGQ